MAQTITRRDGVAEGLAYKRPVACATTANITLSAEQTIDGIVTSGSRVLVKNQTDTTQNGIYVSGTGAWVRALDFDGSTDFTTGTQVYVTSGTTNGQTSWGCTVSADPPVVGTSTITWTSQGTTIANGAITNAKLANANNNTVKGNNSGISAAPSDITASNVLDMVGSTQGDVLYRGASGWAVLAPGTSGQVLASGGASANPTWVTQSSTVFPIATAAGTVDAITATYNPANGALADKLLLAFVATGANTLTNPTFAPDGLTAHTITKRGGGALAPGDIPANLAVCMVEYNLANTRWELLNPAYGVLNRGFDGAVNLTLTASVATSILTVAVKNINGNDPSSGDPVTIPFRDVTIANGGPIVRNVTSALSIDTNAVGATLGSTNATAFRFWVVAFDNGGTVVLGLINCSTATRIFPLDEGTPQSSTAMSGSATSAGVFYTQNGTTVTSKSFRILGYVEYGSAGLVTAGTYASVPTKIQLMGPGIKKPGDLIQCVFATDSTQETTTSSTFVASTNARVTITPTNAANLVRASMLGGSVNTGAAGIVEAVQMSRGTVANTNMIGSYQRVTGSGGTAEAPMTLIAIDKPNATSATTYTLQFKNSDNATTVYILPGGGTASLVMQAEEIMG